LNEATSAEKLSSTEEVLFSDDPEGAALVTGDSRPSAEKNSVTRAVGDTLQQVATAFRLVATTQWEYRRRQYGDERRWRRPSTRGCFLKNNSGNAKLERRMREKYRGAEGAEGGGVWGRGVPLPTGGGVPRENFSILDLK